MEVRGATRKKERYSDTQGSQLGRAQAVPGAELKIRTTVVTAGGDGPTWISYDIHPRFLFKMLTAVNIIIQLNIYFRSEFSYII